MKAPKIIQITHSGIEYVDSTGNNHFIDFEVCKENWNNYSLESQDFEFSDTFDVQKSRCIGRRNSLGNPLFIEFFTEPITRFEFRYTFFRRKAMKAYFALYQAIIKAGWQLFDMT